jgi:outer membrane immunogenic protein
MALRSLLAASIALGALAVSAHAADLGVPRTPVAAAIAAPAFSWTGFYLGLNAGYTFGRATGTDAGDNQQPPVGWYGVGNRFTANTSGFTGGAQAGYNWQAGNIVAGLEADLGYLGARGTFLYGGDTPLTSRGGLFGTLRGRLGVAADRALIYVTAGGIGANIDADVSRPQTNFFGTHTGTQFGWTVGAGIEYAVAQNWSLKAEYLYYDLGSKTLFQNNGNVSRFDVRPSGNIVRVGFNYLFNAGPSAVVARY